MEGSMKMMSWSRYHCLSGSLLRAERRYRAAKLDKTGLRKSRLHKAWLHKIRHRSHAPHPRPPVAGADGARAGYFQFVIRLFRT
jgi:hypothetical protein